MMNTINVTKRNLKEKTRKIREMGFVPGTMYGPEIDNQAIKTTMKEFNHAIAAKGEVYQVKTKSGSVMVKFDEIQTDPLSKQVMHFSLVQLPKGSLSEVEVPLKTSGIAAGEKSGGVLMKVRDHLNLIGPPSKMPKEIDLDVSKLKMGDGITMKDIKLPKGIKFSDPNDEWIVTCSAPNAPMTTEEEMPEDETNEEV